MLSTVFTEVIYCVWRTLKHTETMAERMRGKDTLLKLPVSLKLEIREQAIQISCLVIMKALRSLKLRLLAKLGGKCIL